MSADQVAGAQRCCYGTVQAYCGRPASVHVLLDTDGNPTMSCTEHAHWWDTHDHYDQHPVMAICGLPGTTWMYGELSIDGVTPGRCAVDGLEELAERREAAAERVQ